MKNLCEGIQILSNLLENLIKMSSYTDISQ